MPFRMLGQQRLREVPQRFRAELLHITHARTTNDLAPQQPQMRCGLRVVIRLRAVLHLGGRLPDEQFHGVQVDAAAAQPISSPKRSCAKVASSTSSR
jgi:hypothetical protein